MHTNIEIKLYQPIKLVTVRLQIVVKQSNNSWIKCNFNFCFALNSSYKFFFFSPVRHNLSCFNVRGLFRRTTKCEEKKNNRRNLKGKRKTIETRCSKTLTCFKQQQIFLSKVDFRFFPQKQKIVSIPRSQCSLFYFSWV